MRSLLPPDQFLRPIIRLFPDTKIFETKTETFTDSYRKEMEKSWYRGVSRRVTLWESYVFFYLQKSVQTALFALYSFDLGLYWWCQQLVLGMIKTACIEWTPLHDKKNRNKSVCVENIFLNSVISKWVSSVDLKSVKQCRFFTSSSSSFCPILWLKNQQLLTHLVIGCIPRENLVRVWMLQRRSHV